MTPRSVTSSLKTHAPGTSCCSPKWCRCSKRTLPADSRPRPARRASPGPPRVEAPVRSERQDHRPLCASEELGRGGMGVVYLADDTRLRRRVALKALSPELGREQSGRERLRREAQAAAGLSHPGMATVYALEDIDEELYLVCEYVAGQSLASLLAVRSAAAVAGARHRIADCPGRWQSPTRLEWCTGTSSPKTSSSPRGRHEGARLRTRPSGESGSDRDHPHRRHPGHTRLHGAGTSAGPASGFQDRRVRPGLLVYEMASGTNPFVARTVTATLSRIVETEVPPLSRCARTSRRSSIASWPCAFARIRSNATAAPRRLPTTSNGCRTRRRSVPDARPSRPTRRILQRAARDGHPWPGGSSTRPPWRSPTSWFSIRYGALECGCRHPGACCSCCQRSSSRPRPSACGCTCCSWPGSILGSCRTACGDAICGFG